MLERSAFEFKEEFRCTQHRRCSDFKVWQKTHPNEYKRLKGTVIARGHIVPINKLVKIGHKEMFVAEAIKHFQCTGTPNVLHGKYAYMCCKCKETHQYLENLIFKRKNAALHGTSRLFKHGMKVEYLTSDEKRKWQIFLDDKNKKIEKSEKELKKKLIAGEKIEKNFLEDYISEDFQEFVNNCRKLFQKFKGQIQLTILQNLASKLSTNCNHHYTDAIKKIAALHKNVMGAHNYKVAQNFWIAIETKFCGGFNKEGIERSATTYEGKYVLESSDEARVSRTLQAMMDKEKQVIVVVEAWNPDPSTWPNLFKIQRSKDSESSIDYKDLEKSVHAVRNGLATHVSVHNFTCLTSQKPSLVFCLWPTPTAGYTAECLYKVQSETRRSCRDNIPEIALLEHVADCAGFSHSLAKKLMTTSQENIEKGILYLGLGVPQEKYRAPFFWKFPTIMFTDFEHNQRSALRMLKYSTLDLTLFSLDEVTIIATADHLEELRRKCLKKNIKCGLNEKDILLMTFFDQNSNAAYKVFCEEMIDLLEEHVPDSLGTRLYLKMVICLMAPFRETQITPQEATEKVATGLMMLRLWRAYLQATHCKKLKAQKCAATTPSLRGWFITDEPFTSLEIQAHAVIGTVFGSRHVI